MFEWIKNILSGAQREKAPLSKPQVAISASENLPPKREFLTASERRAAFSRPPAAVEFLTSNLTEYDNDELWNSFKTALASANERGREGEMGSGSATSDSFERGLSPTSALVWNWGQTHGRILSPTALAAKLKGRPLVGGEEHFVFLEVESGRILKFTVPDKYGARGAAKWITNWQRANETFGDDVQIVGAVQATPGTVQLLISQPFIEGRDATQEEITRFMLHFGYHKVGDRTYYHPDKEEAISDAKPANYVTAPDGFVYPIDVHFVTPSERTREVYESMIHARY